MFELKGRYTIVIVTHNMAQARRASDECVFMLMGEFIEHTRTADLFLNPKDPKNFTSTIPDPFLSRPGWDLASFVISGPGIPFFRKANLWARAGR